MNFLRIRIHNLNVLVLNSKKVFLSFELFECFSVYFIIFFYFRKLGKAIIITERTLQEPPKVDYHFTKPKRYLHYKAKIHRTHLIWDILSNTLKNALHFRITLFLFWKFRNINEYVLPYNFHWNFSYEGH